MARTATDVAIEFEPCSCAIGSASDTASYITGQTIYVDDMVGSVIPADDRFLADRAWREGRICREGDPEWETGVPVRQELSSLWDHFTAKG